MPPFAFLEVPPERLNSFLTYVLSIVGGAVAGYVGAVLVGKLVDRAARVKTTDGVPFVHRLFRGLTALAVAILIAIYFFPGGGGGKGNGDGKDDGPDAPNSPAGTGPAAKTDTPAVAPPPPKVDVVGEKEKAYEVIGLRIFGGDDVVGKAFYRLDTAAESEPNITLEELQKVVAERKKVATRPLSIEYRFTRYTGPEFVQGTGRLVEWAAREKLSIRQADGP